MFTLKNFVASLLGQKEHYEPKSERVRRSSARRRKQRHRRQLIGASVVSVAALMIMVTTGFVVADSAAMDEPTQGSAIEDMRPLDVIYTAEHAVPMVASAKAAVEKTIELEEEPTGVITTRLGVYVDHYDADVDYTALMNELIAELEATDDDTLKGHLIGLLEIYETQRNLKVEDLYQDSEYTTSNTFSAEHSVEEIESILFPEPEPESYFTYTEEDAIRLARIIYAEAGSSWITDEHQRDVASVVMNRVLDPRFPDTIEDVINAPGQYPGTCKNLKYDDRCLANAIYVLENGPTCSGIFQANFVQGTTIVATYSYPGLSMTTYICR